MTTETLTRPAPEICGEAMPTHVPDYCRHPALFRIEIAGGLVLLRCGIHAWWYGTHGATVTVLEPISRPGL